MPHRFKANSLPTCNRIVVLCHHVEPYFCASTTGSILRESTGKTSGYPSFPCRGNDVHEMKTTVRTSTPRDGLCTSSQNSDREVVLQGHQNLQSAPLNKIPDSMCQGLQIAMAQRSE